MVKPLKKSHKIISVYIFFLIRALSILSVHHTLLTLLTYLPNGPFLFKPTKPCHLTRNHATQLTIISVYIYIFSVLYISIYIIRALRNLLYYLDSLQWMRHDIDLAHKYIYITIPSAYHFSIPLLECITSTDCLLKPNQI